MSTLPETLFKEHAFYERHVQEIYEDWADANLGLRAQIDFLERQGKPTADLAARRDEVDNLAARLSAAKEAAALVWKRADAAMTASWGS